MNDGSASSSQQKNSARGRVFERRSCRLRLRCRRVKGVGLYSSGERYIEGRVLNQSKGGLMLETPIWFPEGAKLEVAFNSPNGQQSFLGVVEIRWVKKAGNVFHIGAATEDMQRF